MSASIGSKSGVHEFPTEDGRLGLELVQSLENGPVSSEHHQHQGA